MVILACAGVLAMLLTSPDGPSTREEKFRGALLAEVSSVTAPALESPQQRELNALIASRPQLLPAGVVLGFGVLSTLAGPLVFSLAFVIPFGEAGVWITVLAAGLAGIGILTGIIAGIVLAVVGAKLARVDARIRELEELSKPPSVQRFEVPPRLVLARF